MASNLVRVVRTRGLDVLRQLRLEEALLRVDSGNWVIVNDGAPSPAVVLGISGRPHRLVDVAAAHRDGLRVIKRFTGGGTVVVDRDTQFVSIILNRDAVPGLELFPAPLMRWTGELYGGEDNPHAVFRDVPGWRLRENDYVVGDLKVGGNAQSIAKDRWLHHTSFLWNYEPRMMRYLTIPEKQPAYRAGRDHGAFITPLSGLGFAREALGERIEPALRGLGLRTRRAQLADAERAAFAGNVAITARRRWWTSRRRWEWIETRARRSSSKMHRVGDASEARDWEGERRFRDGPGQAKVDESSVVSSGECGAPGL